MPWCSSAIVRANRRDPVHEVLRTACYIRCEDYLLVVIIPSYDRAARKGGAILVRKTGQIGQLATWMRRPGESVSRGAALPTNLLACELGSGVAASVVAAPTTGVSWQQALVALRSSFS